jgi:hypothetical protein
MFDFLNPKKPEFKEYCETLSHQAQREAWEFVFADRPGTVVIGFLVICASIYFGRTLGKETAEQVKEAFYSLGFGILGWGAVYAVSFLLHLFYYTPKHIAADLKQERDGLRSAWERVSDVQAKRREEVRISMLNQASQMLKEAPSIVRSFHAVFKVSAGRQLDNDDIDWLSTEITKLGHVHPFYGIEQLVFQSEWWEFLEWGYRHPTLKFDTKDKYLIGALEFGKKRGRPEPSADSNYVIVKAAFRSIG